MAKLNATRSHDKMPSGRYFFSSEMMAEAKRDVAARNSQAKRAGVKNPKLNHSGCGCGCGIVTFFQDRELAERMNREQAERV